MTERPQGFLRWGVKASFRRYVLSSGGRIDLTRPVLEDGEEFVFPLESVEERENGDRALKFSGEVGFSAHAGALDLRIRDPWVHQLPDESWLSFDGDGGRVLLAEIGGREPIELDGLVVWQSAPTWLALEGTTVFDSIYPPYEELAPATFARPHA